MKNCNIFSKIVIVLALAIGWGGSAWAQGSYEWFTWSNGESYYSVQENSTENASAIRTSNAYLYGNFSNYTTKPTSPTGYWALVPVGDEADKVYRIINAYYGEDFVLGCAWNSGSSGQNSYWKMYPATQANATNNIYTEFIVDNSARDGVTYNQRTQKESEGRKYIKLNATGFNAFMWAPASDGNWRCYQQAHADRSFMKFEAVGGDISATIQQYWADTKIGRVTNNTGLSTVARIGYEASTPLNISQYAAVGSYLRAPARGTVTYKLLDSSGNQVTPQDGYIPEVTVSDGTTSVFLDETEKDVWTINITGAGDYKLLYNDEEHESTVSIGKGIEVSELLFKLVGADNKFVWGPIIDKSTKSIAFTVKDAISSIDEITPGFYQLMLYDDDNKKILDVNNRIGKVAGNINTKSNYIYTTPQKNPEGSDQNLFKFTGVPTYAGEPATYIYFGKNTTGQLLIQSVDGHYTVSESGNAKPVADRAGSYTSNYEITDGRIRIKGWTAPGHWANNSNGNSEGIEGPKVAYGGDYRHWYYMAKADDSQYDVYTVRYNVSRNGSNASQDAKVTCSNANVVGLSSVYNNGYFFFPKNTSVSSSDFSVDGAESITIDPDAKTINVVFPLPTIIHRQHALFDQLATETNKPSNKFIQEGNGLIPHPNAEKFTDEKGYTENDRKIQNTSVFYITQYAEKGGTTSVSLPHTRKGQLGKIQKYQRWYDFETERPLADGILQGLSGYSQYINGIAKKGVTGSVTIKLPADKDSILIGVDDSEFNDYSTETNGDLKEPSLSMRTIIKVVSAEKMASALVQAMADAGGNLVPQGDDKWFEEKTYIVPNIKRGSTTHYNNVDLLPLDMPFSNYWIYNDNKTAVMRVVAENGNNNTPNLLVKVEGDAKDYIEAGIFKDDSQGIGSPIEVKYNHFVYYKMKGEGLTRTVPAGSQAIIKVYGRNGANGTPYQLAKFTLNFQADCEPLAITSVIGDESSTRSREYFKNQQMAEVASLTFAEKKVDFKGFGGVGNDATCYAFPLDPTRTSYAFSTKDAYGGYRITKKGYGMKVLPVSVYEHNILNKDAAYSVAGETVSEVPDDYYLYIDAAEAPGQVASIPLDGNLCPGSRLFFYGWLNSQNPYEYTTATSASVILELVGIKDGKDKVLARYLPGVISDAAYTPEGELVRSVVDGKEASELGAYSYSYNINGHNVATRIAAWQSIGFNYVLAGAGYDKYELRIINNCYSTAGGDYSLDDFRVFVSSPRGNVDFTTPLCSDKTRHAKIYADYDMLKSVSGVNETAVGAKLNASYCFLEADVFDNYSESGLAIKDIYEIDAETGNHSLKSEYRNDATAENLINAAFGKALVGTREMFSASAKNGGFHTMDISLNYESIPEYAYNDSKNQVVYREIGADGIRRIVFKEDVVRGEMPPIEYDGQQHYPHMRPSSTYYFIFKPAPFDTNDITDHTVGTKTFLLQDNCSFFVKFTTKDPLHVILDNAEIDSDLPIRAVCHGETVNFKFDMPVLKAGKPVHDESYCTSAEGEDGEPVNPENPDGRKYKYEPTLTTELIQTTIKDMPYDWWIGGDYKDEEHGIDIRLGGSFADYMTATHPWIKYSHPNDITHKKDGDPVSIAQAMTDFRFYYPDFGKGKTDVDGNCTITDEEWAELTPKDYNSDTGYGLLWSEINTIVDFAKRGILKLHLNTYNMPLTADKAVVEDEQQIVHFTLVPIMPSQKNFVDEPYIYCPEPRGVRMKIYSNEPRMYDGFGDMEYPEGMDNVPVRLGLSQIAAVPYNEGADSKTLRVPLRRLGSAQKNGTHEMHLQGSGYVDNLYLYETDDPSLQHGTPEVGVMKPAVLIDGGKPGDEDAYYLVAKVKKLQAVYTRDDNYMDLQFNPEIKLREGYTYRLGFNFMELDEENAPTLSCYGTMYMDMKVVPEYQKWTGVVNGDWTNDQNWARADRADLHADNKKAGDVIESSTDITVQANYPSNTDNQTAGSFVPMYFTNVLISNAENAPNLYTEKETAESKDLKPANRSEKTFLEGLHSTATENIIYDMEVAPSTGTWHAADNYECTLFGTYVAKGVSFLPGAKLMNTQFLDYKKAWVEYKLDVNRWYTLASPLQDTYSGEWYAPTGSDADNAAKQLTPHFYDINYSQADNDRFRPAIYQRSWDKFYDSNKKNSIYLIDGGEAFAYLTGDWSYVYNDALEHYSTGGFSVKVSDEHMANKPADEKCIIRMPKADAEYTYYDMDKQEGQKADDALPTMPHRYRLWTDLITTTQPTLQQTITNAVSTNNYFLVGNPFMANLDMEAFFEANPQLEKTYWVLSENGQTVSVRSAYDQNANVSVDEDQRWVVTDSEGKLGADYAVVAPLQGFFVKTKDNVSSVTLKYTAGMQTLKVTTLSMLRQPEHPSPIDPESEAADTDESIDEGPTFTIEGKRIPASAFGKGVVISRGKKVIRN